MVLPPSSGSAPSIADDRVESMEHGYRNETSRAVNSLNAPPSYVPAWVPFAVQPPADLVTGLATAISELQTASSGLTSSDFTVDPDRVPDEADPLSETITSAAPPWMVSLVVHLVFILALALLAFSNGIVDPLNIEATFSETFGEQVEEETFAMDLQQLDQQDVVTPTDMTAVEDPLASPHTEVLQLPDQLMATAEFEAPNVGIALSGREPGMKDALLLAYGGDETTEAAVGNALKWLKKNQRGDGAWRLSGPYKDGSNQNNKLAATSMALLAFQGAGFTHKSTREMLQAGGRKVEVDYRKVVRKGWDRMLEWQSKDGNFWKKGRVDHAHHLLYSQAQATIAICELYGMTRDEAFRRPAQRAVNYCVSIQDQDGNMPDGGWKYEPGHDSDLSVTGWFVMALQSARMAGLDVPSDVFAKVSKFLDAVTDEGSFYAYMPGYASKPSLTAEGLLCRQYMGWKRDDPRMQRGIEYLSKRPVDWAAPNTYYWYYATQVMHHIEGDAWFDWNKAMKRHVVANQVKAGPEKGSWSPDDDIWGQGGGRLYMTCLCTYMLEVYYRHLPIYSKL